jgi:thymidylate synthase
MNAYSSLELALKFTLNDVKEKGITTSPRGRESKELIGHGYVLTNPRNRIVGMKERNLNPFYLVGNMLWVLSQSNKLDFINYYNERGSKFSDDGETLRGAYGKRIFDFDGMNQWNECYKELLIDPDTRRAMISIHLPQHDWTGSLDTPCTSDFQFFLRNNQLHMINHMRSQSAAFVQPYDVFLMTMLQELMANELGVDLGIYKHMCGSYHYFTNEEAMVDNIIASKDYTNSMQHMVGGMAEVKKLLLFERQIRLAAIDLKKQNKEINVTTWLSNLASIGLPSYWECIGTVLILKAMNYTGIIDSHPQYKFLIKHYSFGPFSKFFQ